MWRWIWRRCSKAFAPTPRRAGGEATYDGLERCHVHAAPVALKRAFGNLVGNGLKYGHRVRVGLAKTGDAVAVTVDDDGPGIAEAEHERVFRPFFRLEEAHATAKPAGSGWDWRSRAPSSGRMAAISHSPTARRAGCG